MVSQSETTWLLELKTKTPKLLEDGTPENNLKVSLKRRFRRLRMVVKNTAANAQPNKYTTITRTSLRAQPKKTNYGLVFSDYEDLVDFLERVQRDPELVSQIVELLKSEWRPAINTALDIFHERIQCSKCDFVSGGPELRRQLSLDGQKILDALILEMKMFSVEELSAGKLMQFVVRLRSLEKEYLNTNLGKDCKGFAEHR